MVTSVRRPAKNSYEEEIEKFEVRTDWLHWQVTCRDVWGVYIQGSPITDITATTPELGGTAALMAKAARRALVSQGCLKGVASEEWLAVLRSRRRLPASDA